jgi:hypothetical protein
MPAFPGRSLTGTIHAAPFHAPAMNDSRFFARGHAFNVFPSTGQRLSDPLERQLLLEQLDGSRVCAVVARSQPLHSLTPLDFQMGLGRPVDTNPLLTSRNLLQSLTPENPAMSNTLTPAVKASFGSQVEKLGQARATHRLDPLFNIPLGFSPRGSDVVRLSQPFLPAVVIWVLNP